MTRNKAPRLASLLLHSAGATSAEYAILLALVISGLFIAGRALSHATRHSFDKLASTSTGESQGDIALFAEDILREEAESEAYWLGDYPILLERSSMLLLLVACFYLLRRQRKVVQNELAGKEELKTQSPEQLQVYLKRQQIYHTLSSKIDSLFNQVQVQDLMSKRVTTVKPQATVARLRNLMQEKQVRHLLVCDDAQHLLGVISDRDLHCNDSLTAEEVMTREPIAVPPDALVSTVISLMLKEQISSVPIVRDGQIQGLMTTTDLIMAMQCALQLWHLATDDRGGHVPQEPQQRETPLESVEAEELEEMTV